MTATKGVGELDPASVRPQISIALAAYNGARYIGLQLQSILSQLGTNDEVVVVDDASTDDTIARVEAFRDPRIKILANPSNRGVFHTFERALQATSGEIVFLSDQDDVWEPNKVSTILSAFQDPKVSLVLSDAAIIDAEGGIIEPSFYTSTGPFSGSLFQTLLRNRYLGCTMAMRKMILRKVLPFPPRMPMHDMWIGVVNRIHGKVIFINQPLMRYRRHGGNVSRSGNLIQKLRWRAILAENVIQALWR